MSFLVVCIVHVTGHHISGVEHKVRMEVEPRFAGVQDDRIRPDGLLARIIVAGRERVLRHYRKEFLTGNDTEQRKCRKC